MTTMISGCVPQYHIKKTEIRPLYSSNAERVDGLRQALSDSPDSPVRIIVVHGMITSEPKYSENLQQRLAEKLGLILSKREEYPTYIYRGYDFIPSLGPQPFDGVIHLKASEVRKSTWVDPSNLNADRLVIYEVLWAPLRDEVKNHFFACFESRSIDPGKECSTFSKAERNSDYRTIINGALKDSILVNGFADPMIVLGPIGDILRDDITQAICMIASDTLASSGFNLKQSQNMRCDLSSVIQHHKSDQISKQVAATVLEKTKFFAMTHSLGSFLFMDAQQRFAQTRARKNGEISQLSKDEIQESLLFSFTDHATVFMRANQIALLQLGRFSAEGCRPHNNESECPNRLLRVTKKDDTPLGSLTTYVAFNDVNDLLGFELPPYLAATSLFGTLVNVSVQNPGLNVPFIFKNPGAAHLGHEDNPAVIEAMVDGIVFPEK
ncbi:MAG TPA: hypothetical protein PK389_00475 [Gammaproteobacteria bacterium]|nr:hypothetical protein [Gammaproteobacteria bacterium]